MVETIIQLDDPRIAVRLRVSAAARRFTLRLEPAGDGAVLTLPSGVPLAQARMFLLRQSDWLAGALARHPGRIEIGVGTLLPVGGAETRVVLAPGPRRAPVLADGRLVLAGPGAPGPRIAAFLKARARDALVPAARRYGDAGPRRGGGDLARHPLALGVVHLGRASQLFVAAGDGAARGAGLRRRPRGGASG
jgi:predicted metal-dependent hydrolase